MRHRRTMANWTIITAALMTIALFGFAGRLLAQEASAAITPNFDAIPVFPGMTIVVPAVTDNRPKPERDIVLQRRVGINPHDVILVRPGGFASGTARPGCRNHADNAGSRWARTIPRRVVCSGGTPWVETTSDE